MLQIRRIGTVHAWHAARTSGTWRCAEEMHLFAVRRASIRGTRRPRSAGPLRREPPRCFAQKSCSPPDCSFHLCSRFERDGRDNQRRIRPALQRPLLPAVPDEAFSVRIRHHFRRGHGPRVPQLQVLVTCCLARCHRVSHSLHAQVHCHDVLRFPES